jgi:uncharacterized membrane protein
MVDPSSEIRPKPFRTNTNDIQAQSSNPKAGIELKESRPKPLAQGVHPSTLAPETQPTQLTSQELFWNTVSSLGTLRGFCLILVFSFPVSLATLYWEPLMDRWGGKGIWAGAGCWLFIYVMVLIFLVIIYNLVFWTLVNKKERGQAERDVEAGLGSSDVGWFRKYLCSKCCR